MTTAIEFIVCLAVLLAPFSIISLIGAYFFPEEW